MSTQTHSQRALDAAFASLSPCHERTALVILSMALARRAEAIVGREKAALLAYQIADQLVDGGRK